jgi:molybdate transport system substrate-binding protein
MGQEYAMKIASKIFSIGALFLFSSQAAVHAQGAAARLSDARPGDVRVLASTGLKAAIDPVRSDAEKTIGHHLVIEYGPSKGLQTSIEGGAVFEVAILTRDVIDEMTEKGKIAKGSAVDIGHVVVSFAVKGDAAPKDADIKTSAGIKKLLLGAKQVRWLGIGASAPTVANLLNKLELTGALAGKTSIETSNQMVPQVAGPGEYEVLMNLNSELHAVNGWTILGQIPAAYQVPIIESVGIGPGGDASLAKMFIDFMRGPVFEKSLTASGMTR